MFYLNNNINEKCNEKTLSNMYTDINQGKSKKQYRIYKTMQ